MVSFLGALDARADQIKVKVPDDVRAFFVEIDRDSKLREALDVIDVRLEVDDRTQADCGDVLLFFGFHEQRLAGLDSMSGDILRKTIGEPRWDKVESFAQLLGDILVDAIDHSDNEEPAYVVLGAMEHVHLPISLTLRKAFKSLTR